MSAPLPYSKTITLAHAQTWKSVWKPVYVLVLTGVLFAGYIHWAYDDPFITYRYAENLRAGLGFVYNPGERILSTTTPLFTLLLALLGKVWSNLPLLANLIGAFSLAIGGLFIWDLARSWDSPLAGWFGLFVYPTFPLLLATIGSETLLYLGFCLGAFAFYARKQYGLVALFSALAILARPDGVLVPLILSLDFILRERRPIPWSSVGLFLGINLLWFAFAWVYFGDPLPVTLAAKQNQGSMAVSQRFAAGLYTTIKPYLTKWYFWLQAVLGLSGLLFIALKKRRWALFLSWPVLYFISYTLLGVSRYFWYYAPLVPGFVLLAGIGLDSLYVRVSRISTRWQNKNLRVPSILATILILLAVSSQAADLLKMRQLSDHRYPVYRAVGEWLHQNAPSQAKVAALEVGIIGYFSHRPMVDFAGLIQPEVAARLKGEATYEDAAIWALDHFSPNYVLLHEGIFERLEHEHIQRQCTLAKNFLGKEYGYSLDLHLYSCPR